MDTVDPDSGDGNPKPNLAEEYLRERGVFEKTFIEHGGEIDSPLSPSKISQRLARNYDDVCRNDLWARVKAVLWFKVCNSNGELVHYLARPLPSYGEAKFVAPIGSDSMPWIPPETRDVAKDIDKPLVVTEGPVKGMSLLQVGAFPISLVGVWGVAASKKKTQPAQDPSPDSDDDDRMDDPEDRNDDGHDDGDPETADLSVRKIHPELARFTLEYRQVLFCFDADHLKNRNVRQAELGRYFRRAS